MSGGLGWILAVCVIWAAVFVMALLVGRFAAHEHDREMAEGLAVEEAAQRAHSA
ncbi:MAG: hypothetical protein OJF49_001708 [Ktedonobacterales bacterium]|jgi:uncharacterized membrane protein|nr:MAG: hypothetical protein OJF49_001708 [Ktedonobacterales bacterium]